MSMSIDVDMEDPKVISKVINRSIFFAKMGACDAINDTLIEMQKRATGNLTVTGVSQSRPEASINASWRIKSAQLADMLEPAGTLYNTSPHAGFVEVGTGPYAETNYFGKNYNRGTLFITPKNSDVLKFTYGTGVRPFKTQIKKSPDVQGKRGTTQYIFAHYVEGQEPKNYLGRALLSLQPQMLSNMGTAVMAYLTRVEKGI